MLSDGGKVTYLLEIIGKAASRPRVNGLWSSHGPLRGRRETVAETVSSQPGRNRSYLQARIFSARANSIRACSTTGRSTILPSKLKAPRP